jgi:hypothetical protein
MSYNTYVNYSIWFSDLVEYNAAVVYCGGNGFGGCPTKAQAAFGLPGTPSTGGPQTGDKGWFVNYGGSLTNILFPNPSGISLPENVDSVTIPWNGSGTNPSVVHIWWGNIIYMANEYGALGIAEIPQRRWIGGFEYAGTFAEGNTSGMYFGGVRDGSRGQEGLGYKIRGTVDSDAMVRTINKFRAGLAPKTSWERFYIRIDNLGTNEFRFWRCLGTGGQGAVLALDTTGNLLIYSTTLDTGGTLLATAGAAFNVGEWYLFDVLITYPTIAADSGNVRVYINHTLFLTGTSAAGTGIDAITTHTTSKLGQFSTAEDDWEVSFDDWICADVPNILGVESLTSVDWLAGSHVRWIKIESAVLTGYAGSGEMLNAAINTVRLDESRLTSTTALATVEALAEDMFTNLPSGPGTIGPVAIQFDSCNYSALSRNNRLAYSIAGGAYVYANIAVAGGEQWAAVAYLPTGLTFPVDPNPILMLEEHVNDATNQYITGFAVEVEEIGIYGPEDGVTNIDISNNLYQHNARYCNSNWALFPFAGVPNGPVYVIGGTYTGNGLEQIIDLPAPAHFIFIRSIPLSAAYPVTWFASGLAGSRGGQGEVYGNYVTRSWIDSAGQAHFSISGNPGPANDATPAPVDYQYIIFCDPGMRFNYCGAYSPRPGETSRPITLFDPTWIPQAGFVQRQFMQSVGTNLYLTYKGIGDAGNAGQDTAGALKANFGSFGAGLFTAKASNIQTSTPTPDTYAFSLWRMADSGGCENVVQLTSYIGDGNVFKVINFPKSTGKYPLLVFVTCNNLTDQYFRDPSHAGNASSTTPIFSSLNTGIMGGGVDEITVGITLNALGDKYEVFALMGSDVGWINGTFYACAGPSSGPWDIPQFAPPDQPIITGDGGLLFNGQMGSLVAVNMSGIYTLVKNKRNDTFYTGVGKATTDVKIAKPEYKTGYIGG